MNISIVFKLINTYPENIKQISIWNEMYCVNFSSNLKRHAKPVADRVLMSKLYVISDSNLFLIQNCLSKNNFNESRTLSNNNTFSVSKLVAVVHIQFGLISPVKIRIFLPNCSCLYLAIPKFLLFYFLPCIHNVLLCYMICISTIYYTN